MANGEEKTVLEQIAEKRAARRKALVHEPRARQEEADMAAIDALEESMGTCLHTLDASGYVPGVSVKMAFRPASNAEYKRYVDTIGRSTEKNRAEVVRKSQDQLARSCIVYPEGSSRDAFLDAFPGALVSIALEVARLAELSKEEEGKG